MGNKPGGTVNDVSGSRVSLQGTPHGHHCPPPTVPIEGDRVPTGTAVSSRDHTPSRQPRRWPRSPERLSDLGDVLCQTGGKNNREVEGMKRGLLILFGFVGSSPSVAGIPRRVPPTRIRRPRCREVFNSGIECPNCAVRAPVALLLPKQRLNFLSCRRHPLPPCLERRQTCLQFEHRN